MPAVIKTCNLFNQTFAQHQKQLPTLGKKVEDFLRFKTDNPTQPYGSSDYSMNSNAPIGRAVPKIRHAHLTKDLSVFYAVSGIPTTLYLFAILGHKEAGTGDAPNIKTQKNVGKAFKSQDFS